MTSWDMYVMSCVTSCVFVMSYVTSCIFVMSYVTSGIFGKFLMFFNPLLTIWRMCDVMTSQMTICAMIWRHIDLFDILRKFLMLFYPLLTKNVCDVTYIFRYDMYVMSHMTSVVWYDEMHLLWYVYDNNREPCNRWLETRAGGHGPAVPLPPGSWSVGPVVAAGAMNSVNKCEVCA